MVITGDNTQSYGGRNVKTAISRAANRKGVSLSKVEIKDIDGYVRYWLYDNFGKLVGVAKNNASIGFRLKVSWY